MHGVPPPVGSSAPKNCESQTTWFRNDGLGSGAAFEPQVGFDCWSPDGEVLTSPPPASEFPLKQLVGASLSVNSAMSPFVSLPKPPLFLKVFFSIALPQSSYRQVLFGAPVPP